VDDEPSDEGEGSSARGEVREEEDMETRRASASARGRRENDGRVTAEGDAGDARAKAEAREREHARENANATRGTEDARESGDDDAGEMREGARARRTREMMVKMSSARGAAEAPTRAKPSRNIFADAQRRQWCRERQTTARRGGAPSAKLGATALRCSNKRFVEELRLRETLERHGGCVNCVSWNEDASLLISGSDDMTVCVWGLGAKMPLKGSVFTGHTHNVFASEFVPQTNSAYCVTTSADGDVRLVDLERGFQGPEPAHYGYRLRGANRPNCDYSRSLWHGNGAGMGFGMTFVPNEPNTFLTAHQDGRIRLFDLRQSHGGFEGNSHETIVDLTACGPTSEIVFDPTAPTTFAACSDDPHVRVFDLRHVKSNRREVTRECPLPPSPGTSPTGRPMFVRSPRPSMSHNIPTVMMISPLELSRGVRSMDFEGISGVAYSKTGELAISCKGDDVYLLDTRRAAASLNSEDRIFKSFNVPITHVPAKRYVGRKNVKTFLKGVAFMCDDEYVTTGGDDGNLYVWNKETCELVCKMQADSQVVNTVLPHPHLPTLVCCGIDNHVRVFEAGDGGVHLGTPPKRDENDMWFDDGDDEDEFADESGDDEDEDEDEDDDDESSEEDERRRRRESRSFRMSTAEITEAAFVRWARVMVDATVTLENDYGDDDDEDDEDFDPMQTS